MTASARTAEEWTRDLAAGDSSAIDDLTRRVRGWLRKTLASRGGVNDADLDDLTQDALVRILEGLESFRGDSKFETWAMTVAVRNSFSTLRKRSWGDVSLDGLELPPRVDPESVDPDSTASQDDLLGVLRTAIDTHLSDRQRTVILGELAGVPGPVLVEQLGTNPNALYKLYHDARKKLRGALEEAGFGDLDVRSILEGASG